MKRLIHLVALAASMTMTVSAHASNADWKLLQYVTAEEPEVCFYEARDIFRTENGHVSVWTKCLRHVDLDNFFAQEDTGATFENVATKIAHNYKPPIAEVEAFDAKQVMQITIYEEMANNGGLQPRETVLHELDCAQGVSRELSFALLADDQIALDQKSIDWHQVSLEGNSASLLKSLCPMQ